MRKLVFCLTLAIVALAQGSDSGATSGTVLDERGRPLSGATVSAWLIPAPTGSHHLVPLAMTDAGGRFSILRLSFGKYALAVAKEDDGYPNTAWGMFRDNFAQVTVELGKDAPTASVVLRPAPKGGMLVGSVTDALTGEPIARVGFTIWRIDMPSRWHGAGTGRSDPGPYRLVIPPDVSIGVRANAPGYQAWYYPGTPAASEAQGITLHSGETVTINVRMVPEAR